MNIPSLLRTFRKKLFGATAPRRTPFRYARCPALELLENRVVPAVPPKIVAISPPDLSTSGAQNPPITITFNEAMDQNDVSLVSNYMMFDSAGKTVAVNQASYNPQNFTVTLTYNNSVTLPVGAYTLFVKGDLVHDATDTFTLSPAGQILTTNSGNRSVSTVNVGPTGILNAVSTYPVQAFTASFNTNPPPYIIAVGDFNGARDTQGNPILDIAVLDNNPATFAPQIDIFGGTPDHQFNTSKPVTTLTLPAGAIPYAMVAAQLNNFAAGPDIAVTDNKNAQVLVYKNTSVFGGAISFSAFTGYAAGKTPVGLAAGDFDGDGNTDLAVVDTTIDTTTNANLQTWDVDVLGGNGNGTLKAAVIVPISNPAQGTSPVIPAFGVQNPNSLAAGTLQPGNVGLSDLAVTGSNGVEPLLNATTQVGKFAFTSIGAVSQQNPNGWVALGNTAYSHVAIGPTTKSPTPGTVGDIVVTGLARATVTDYLNNGSGRAFTGQAPITIGATATGLALGDLSGGRGQGDSAIIVAPTLNAFQVLPSSGTGLGAPVSYQTDNGPLGVLVVGEQGGFGNDDINADGFPDVVTINNGLGRRGGGGGVTFSVARGNGNGTFADNPPPAPVGAVGSATPPTATETAPAAPIGAVVGDLNGDGIPDYVVADGTGNSVSVYLGVAPAAAGGPLTYTYAGTFSTLDGNGNGLDPVSVTLADLTGTGTLDIVTADYGTTATSGATGYISILANTSANGKFSLARATTVRVGEGPTQVIAGLFDTLGGKRAQDLIVSHNGTDTGTQNQGVTVLVNANAGNRTFQTPYEIGGGHHATAVASADFNADGNLDFVFTDAGSPQAGVFGPGSLIEMLGDGTGHFTQFGSPVSVNPDPVALAVADLNRDGYADVVVGSGDSNSPTRAIASLINSVGFGFQPAIFTPLPGNAVVTGLTVTDLNEKNADPYPDVIAATAPTSTSSNPFVPNTPVDDGLVALQGVGDGTFTNIVPYEVGGPPSNTSPATNDVVTVADPFLRVLTFFKGGSIVRPNLVANGDFEARDFSGSAGNLQGWQTSGIPEDPTGSRGAWLSQTGNLSPLSQTRVPTPPQGAFQAMLDQSVFDPDFVTGSDTNLSEAGSNFLYQDFTIPANDPSSGLTVTGTLTFTLFLDNLAGAWSTGPSNPAQTLDYRTSQPDQQVRVDLMNPSAPIYDATPFNGTTGSVYTFGTPASPVFVTNQGTTTDGSVTFTATLDLTALAGKRVRLRVAAVNNQGRLVVGVDNVSLQVTYSEPSLDVPEFSRSPQLRNPGPQVTVNTTQGQVQNVPLTTDPTIIGQVADAGVVPGTQVPYAGNVNNIAFVAFDPTGTGNFNGPSVVRTNTFDASGNFAVTLPNLPYSPIDPVTGRPEAITVSVRVQDKAGHHTDFTMPLFVYQGPSLNVWQAVGPNQINSTADPSVTYGSVSGRVTAEVADPSDPTGTTYFLGSANGGIWKTFDGGANWIPLTDFVVNQGTGAAVNVPVGAIAVAKAGEGNLPGQYVYAGTGDGDQLPDSRGGIGVLVSTDGGLSWSVTGNVFNAQNQIVGNVFAGARITAAAVDPRSPLVAYMAVAYNPSAFGSGPGVYRTTDGGKTWVNVLTLNSLNLPTGVTLPANTGIGSVTSMVLDPQNPDDLVIGIGNINFVAPSATAGVWRSANAWDPNQPNVPPTWTVLGDVTTADPRIANDTLPSDLRNDGSAAKPFQIGRVTVAQSVTPQDEKYYYVLISNPTAASRVAGVGGVINGVPLQNSNNGNGLFNGSFTNSTNTALTGNGVSSPGYEVTTTSPLVAGLFKSRDFGVNWTRVMIRSNTGGDMVPPGSNDPPPNFRDIDLTGNDGNNIGALTVDPTDPNVVYVGGADNQFQTPINNAGAADNRFSDLFSPGLIRVDTGDMMDTVNGPLEGGIMANNGDDLLKDYYGWLVIQNVKGRYAYPTADGGVAYTGEGVSWYALEINQFEPPWPIDPNTFLEIPSNLPGQTRTLLIDPLGRILVGTDQGVFRMDYHGAGYDQVSGINWFWDAPAGIVTDITTGNQVGGNTLSVPPANVTVTSLNSNLQIGNLTSVAIDPSTAGLFYASGYDTGTEQVGGGGVLGWQTMGLTGGIGFFGNVQLVYNGQTITVPNGLFNRDAGTVLTAPVDPKAVPGTPTTVFVNYAYLTSYQQAPPPLGGFDPEASTLGGALSTFSPFPQDPRNAGISPTNFAGYTPFMGIDPNLINNGGQNYSLLIYGTDRIYTTRTGSNAWDDRVGRPLSTNPSSYVTAAAIAPSSNGTVFYAGTNNGEVFAELHNGADKWPQVGVGTLPNAPVTDITVDPTNALLAYVTFGGVGAYAHVWMTPDGGKSWVPLQGTLPPVGVYSLVTDPRPQLSAGAPFGHLYVGTDIGVYVSVNRGVTWQKLGVGLPNVPVVSMQFNQKLEELVVGTQGRGAFQISTDRNGPAVVAVSPATPVAPGLSSVTVTFNKTINGASFTPGQVDAIVGPNGVIWQPGVTPAGTITITDVTPTPAVGSNPHNVFQITFPTQTTDGVYTFVIGPNIQDLVGNPMDQNGNTINGENPGDRFTFTVAINSSDDGHFVTGLYNNILGRSADTVGFETLLNIVDGARNALLPGIATSFVLSPLARGQLITDLYSSGSSPLSTIGIGNLLPGFSLTQAQINALVAQLQAGVSLEQIIDSIVASALYFNRASVGGTDAGFVSQLYQDLAGITLTPGQVTTLAAPLQTAEGNARIALAEQLVTLPVYTDNYIYNGNSATPGGFQNWLGRAPTSAELTFFENQFRAGMTQEQFIATMLGNWNNLEFFRRAPTIVGSGYSANEAFVRAVYQELMPGLPLNPTAGKDANVNFWLGQLATLGPTGMVTAFVANPSYRYDPNYGLIAQYYQKYLGTTLPLSQGIINAWIPQFQNGLSTQNFLAILLASGTYYQNHVGSATTLAGQDGNWVNALYLDAIGPTDINGNALPTQAQFNYTVNALAAAEQNARFTLATGLTATPTYHNVITTAVYKDLLGRTLNPANATDASVLAYWNGILSLPSAGPGQPSRDEQMLIALLGSSTYFNAQTDPANGLHDDLAWAKSLYPSLLLPANPTAAATVASNLLASYLPARAQAAAILLNTTEYRTRVVNTDYQLYLNRAPQPYELSYWVAQLAAGVPDEYLIANLIAPNATVIAALRSLNANFNALEFYNLSPNILGLTSGPTTSTFVQAAYKLLFPTYVLPASVLNGWTAALANGSYTLSSLAQTLANSFMYFYGGTQDISGNQVTGGRLSQLYNQMLGRNPTTTERNFWINLFPLGYRDETVLLYLAEQPEYFNEPHPFP